MEPGGRQVGRQAMSVLAGSPAAATPGPRPPFSPPAAAPRASTAPRRPGGPPPAPPRQPFPRPTGSCAAASAAPPSPPPRRPRRPRRSGLRPRLPPPPRRRTGRRQPAAQTARRRPARATGSGERRRPCGTATEGRPRRHSRRRRVPPSSNQTPAGIRTRDWELRAHLINFERDLRRLRLVSNRPV